MNDRVWVVGKYKHGENWELQGVFSSEQLAVEACGTELDRFIGPAVIDEVLPSEAFPWPGAYYPNSDQASKA